MEKILDIETFQEKILAWLLVLEVNSLVGLQTEIVTQFYVSQSEPKAKKRIPLQLIHLSTLPLLSFNSKIQRQRKVSIL